MQKLSSYFTKASIPIIFDAKKVFFKQILFLCMHLDIRYPPIGNIIIIIIIIIIFWICVEYDNTFAWLSILSSRQPWNRMANLFFFMFEDPQINLDPVLALYILLSWFSCQRLLRLSKAYIPFTWVNLSQTIDMCSPQRSIQTIGKLIGSAKGIFEVEYFNKGKYKYKYKKEKRHVQKKRHFYQILAI